MLLLHTNSLVLDDLRFYYEVIYVIFIYEFNGYAIYEIEETLLSSGLQYPFLLWDYNIHFFLCASTLTHQCIMFKVNNQMALNYLFTREIHRLSVWSLFLNTPLHSYDWPRSCERPSYRCIILSYCLFSEWTSHQLLTAEACPMYTVSHDLPASTVHINWNWIRTIPRAAKSPASF